MLEDGTAFFLDIYTVIDGELAVGARVMVKATRSGDGLVALKIEVAEVRTAGPTRPRSA